MHTHFLIRAFQKISFFTSLFLLSISSSAVTLTVNMFDSYGDGWNGAYWYIYNSSGTQVASGTLASGYSGSATTNQPDGCYTFSVTGGGYPDEVTWTLSGVSIPANPSGGAGASFDFSVGAANCDFEGMVQIVMNDSGGNGWQGTTWYISTTAGTPIANGTLESGSSGSQYLTLADGCYFFHLAPASFAYQCTWSLLDVTSGNTLLTGTGNSPDQIFYIGYTPCNPSFALAEGEFLIETWNTQSLTGSMSLTNTDGIKVLDVPIPINGYGWQVVSLPSGCYTFQFNSNNGNSSCYYQFKGWNGLIKSGNLTTNKFFAFCHEGITRGCMDTEACNYDAPATLDDGSCCYDVCAHVQVTGAGPTFTWVLFRNNVLVLKGSGNFEGSSCFEYSSLYFMSMSDTQGQAGNGAIYTVSDALSGEIFSSGGMTAGSASSQRLSIGGRFGCMDTNASNFDPLATCDNGLCCFDNAITFDIHLNSSGNNGSVYIYTLDEVFMDQVYMPNGYFATDQLCLPVGCYKFQFYWPASVTNVTVKQGNTVLLNQNYVQNQQWYQFCVADLDAGCTNLIACNFGSEIVLDNGGCCISNCVFFDFDYQLHNLGSELYWELLDENGNRVANAEADGQLQLCLPNGCYTLHRFNSVSSNANFTVTNLNTGEILVDAFMNYQDIPFTFCVMNHPGCMDPAACNYSDIALFDDGSCCYTNCAQLVFIDFAGDGWEGSSISLQNHLGDVFEGTLENGDSLITQLCLVDGCYTMNAEGPWDGESAWQLKMGDVIIATGTPGFASQFTIGAEAEGCTDPAAINYNPASNCDNCTCQYTCKPDLDNNGAVNINDLLLFMTNFGCQFNCCRFDFTDDGAVNTGDYLIMSSVFGGYCPD